MNTSARPSSLLAKMCVPSFRLRAILLALALSLLATAPAQPTSAVETSPSVPALTKETKEEILLALQEVVTQRAFVPGVDLAKWPEFLAKQREAIDKAEKDTEFARAVNVAMRDFGISHIRFITPRGAESRNRTSTIGIGVRARPGTDGLTITFVFPKSPADAVGIKEGETITRIDGKLPDTPEPLQGAEGTEAVLTIRARDGAERELRVKRQTYSTARPDTLTWVGDDAAVLKVHTFSRGYERTVIERLMGEAARAKYLVLDLRSNGGGSTTNLRHLLSMFLPEDTVIGTFVNRDEAARYANRNGGKIETDPVVIAKDAMRRYTTRRYDLPPFKGKVAVLINRGSASASEICAAALREHLRTPIVGTRSAGAVLASVFRTLPKGYEVQYPVSDYVTNGGVRLEKNPVVPDIEVTERPEEGKDPARDQALERLRSLVLGIFPRAA